MIFTNEVSAKIAVVILSLCGLWVAKHIRKHKVEGAPLVCPIGFDCHAVVHSDYSKFLGMPVELLGMIYYACFTLLNLVLIFVPNIFSAFITSASLVMILIVISLAAFLFSLYLISVQIFVIKKGCSWCIVSSIVSALIFLLSMVK